MPSLSLNGGTTKFILKVVDYQKYNLEEDNISFCDIILSIKNYYLNYKTKLNNIILNIELEKLIELIEKLLFDKIKDTTSLFFESPDLSFKAYKIDDSIWLDIIVNFPTEGNVYDAEKWIVSLDCEEIIDFYLQLLSEIAINNDLWLDVKNKMENLLKKNKNYVSDPKIINDLINKNIISLEDYKKYIPSKGEYLCLVATYGKYGKEYTFLCRGVKKDVIWKVEGEQNVINFKRYILLKEEDLPVPLDKMKYAVATEIDII